MSNYGKLWERASDVRAELKTLMPDLPTNRLTDAAAYLKGRVDITQRIGQLMVSWARLERQMESCDD